VAIISSAGMVDSFLEELHIYDVESGRPWASAHHNELLLVSYASATRLRTSVAKVNNPIMTTKM
jgi:hypothetical protein